MHRFVTAAAVLLSASNAIAQQEQLDAKALFKRDHCAASGAFDDGGTQYCTSVQGITYANVGHPASYQQVVGNDGSCQFQTKEYSGSLAPFDEDLALIFRGPLKLKQFAAYTPSGNKKREAHAEMHAHGHAHAHAHHEAHKREAAPSPLVGDLVTATIDGQVVTWTNTYDGNPPAGGAGAAAPAAPAAAPAAPAAAPAVHNNAAANSNSNAGSGSFGSSSSGGAWTRQGYYNAEQKSSKGLSFLTSHFSVESFVASDGVTLTSDSQVLGDVQIPSDREVHIYTDQPCDGSCGFVKPGTQAMKGFGGSEKVFLIEFGMPSTGEQEGTLNNPDKPAIWALNAQITRNEQYGPCSCWKSGCGEFDIYEVLTPGNTKAVTCIHGNWVGGDADYFDRPVDGTKKIAVIMSNDSFHVKILDAGQTFDESLDGSFISNIVSSLSGAPEQARVYQFGH